MALGDYTKVTYKNGEAPGISANNLNNNENKTEELDNALATHLAEDATNAHLAKNIGLEDTAGNFTATELEGALSELFTNVSNGKTLVGGAIAGVDENISIPADPTFQQLADAIGQINTGKKHAIGTGDYEKGFAVNNLNFNPSLIIITTQYSCYSYFHMYKNDFNPSTSDGYSLSDRLFGISSYAYTDGTQNLCAFRPKGFISLISGGFTVKATNNNPGLLWSWLAIE